MAGVSTEKETLNCPGCGRVIASSRTVGKSDDVAVTCPACKDSSLLGEWRSTDSSDLPPTVSAPLPTDSQKEFAASLGIEVPEGINQPALMSLIDDVLEKRDNARYDLFDWRVPVCMLIIFVAGLFLLASIAGLGTSLVSEVHVRERFRTDNAPAATANAVEAMQQDIRFIRIAVHYIAAIVSAFIWARVLLWARNKLRTVNP